MVQVIQILACAIAMHWLVPSEAIFFKGLNVKKTFDFEIKPKPFKPLSFIIEKLTPFKKWSIKKDVKRSVDEAEEVDDRINYVADIEDLSKPPPPVYEPIQEELPPLPVSPIPRPKPISPAPITPEPDKVLPPVPSTLLTRTVLPSVSPVNIVTTPIMPLGPLASPEQVNPRRLPLLTSTGAPLVLVTPPPPPPPPVAPPVAPPVVPAPMSNLLTDISQSAAISNYLQSVQGVLGPLISGAGAIAGPAAGPAQSVVVDAPVPVDNARPFQRGSRFLVYIGDILVRVLSRLIDSARTSMG